MTLANNDPIDKILTFVNHMPSPQRPLLASLQRDGRYHRSA
jgi:hypothetical protein